MECGPSRISSYYAQRLRLPTSEDTVGKRGMALEIKNPSLQSPLDGKKPILLFGDVN